MTSAGTLDGIRVLDFGRYIAGPYCAAMLGDLGADVIRVERPGGGEDRQLIPLSDTADGGALYVQANRNKRGFTLDSRSEAGREVMRRLVATADVVVANLPDRSLGKLGLDYATLTSVKEDVVLTTISAFGDRGPWAERPGFDGVGQAMAGAAFLSGERDVPSKSYMLWVDFATAAFSAFATLAALHDRDTTGTGQHVRGSLLGSALTVGNSALIEEAVRAVGRKGTGNRAQVAGPADVYETQDGWVIVQVVGDAMFRRWAAAVGREDLAVDPHLATDQQRGDARNRLAEAMQPWCAGQTTDAALERLAAAGVPAGPVLSPAAALVHPQVAAGDWLQPVPYPNVDPAPPIARLPVELDGVLRSHAMRAPLLGEHTNEILREIGYDESAIAGLRRSGAV